MSPIEVSPVPGPNLREPLRLLEEWLREGEPVPEPFLKELRRHVEAGDIEVLAANLEGRMVGVLVLAFRPNVSLGAPFASIEDLYVYPQFRRQGVGRILLQAAADRCSRRGVSYLEAQVEENAADAFYAASGYEAEPGARVLSRSLPIGGGGDKKLKADG
ncbi:MAG: GNAT family N-acetyltransferase [Actinomycetota bacterium]|nr:GNAT family N-acetyltransferase [Actinomycetota bacterium]